MKIYLNKEFLVNFMLSKDAENDLHTYISRLIGSPQNTYELVIDFDIEEAYQSPFLRPIIRQIAQNLPVTDLNFLTDCQQASFHDSAVPRLFFVDGFPELTLDKRFGCFITSSDHLEKAEFLFYVEEMPICAPQRDWSVLSKIKHPCNALILTDNYFFSNDYPQLENLYSILNALMPPTLDPSFEFHLTIIGYDSKKEYMSLQKQHDDLQQHLKKQYTYPVNLTIIRESRHVRNIMTNYYRLVCEKGFALFKNKRIERINETTVDCKPLSHFGRFSSASEAWKEELSRISKINQMERISDRLAGDRRNRLLQ